MIAFKAFEYDQSPQAAAPTRSPPIMINQVCGAAGLCGADIHKLLSFVGYRSLAAESDMAHNLKRIVKRNQADLAMEPTDAPAVARRWRVHDKVPAALVCVRLKWKKAYECGEPSIDAQHCELFKLANAAFDASFKMATERAQFLAAIDRLLAHIVKHFAYEEETLAMRRYDDLAQHKLEHADLLAKGRALRVAVTAHRITTGDLVEFIADKVVAHHLFAADRDFFPLFSHQPAHR